VDVDETEVVYVEVGQSAKVLVDALRERSYSGKVVEIGSSGYSKPQQPDVTFFKVKALLDDADAALRPGMSARAEILTATSPQAWVVPIQSVVDRPPVEEENGDDAAAKDEIKVVFVVENSKATQRPVEVGLSDETSAEILSGLAGGEQAVTGPYRALRKLKHGDPVKITKESDDDDLAERDREEEESED
jgi:HlyD family secretion protein